MKVKRSSIRNSVFITLMLVLASNVSFSQVIETPDSLKVAKTDSLKTIASDSLKAIKAAPVVTPAVVPVAAPKTTPADKPKEAPAAAPAEPQKATESKTDDKPDKKKDKKGKKNEIILYSGVNFTQLSSSATYKSEAATGYQLGAYYKQGRMFFWQAGARYASSKIGYEPLIGPVYDAENLSVSDIQIPLTLGVNFTSFMNRVLSVRLFASAVPSFTLKVGDNPYGFTKDNINSFILYGQGGLGINVAFFVMEVGYDYGFNELLMDNTDSKPGQLFINLGFRF